MEVFLDITITFSITILHGISFIQCSQKRKRSIVSKMLNLNQCCCWIWAFDCDPSHVKYEKIYDGRSWLNIFADNRSTQFN